MKSKIGDALRARLFGNKGRGREEIRDRADKEEGVCQWDKVGGEARGKRLSPSKGRIPLHPMIQLFEGEKSLFTPQTFFLFSIQ